MLTIHQSESNEWNKKLKANTRETKSILVNIQPIYLILTKISDTENISCFYNNIDNLENNILEQYTLIYLFYWL